MEPEMACWLRNTARKNLWRAPKWYSEEDLVQDGYLLEASLRYRRVRSRTARNYFRRSFSNELHDLANWARRHPHETSISHNSTAATAAQALCSEDMLMAVAEAPEPYRSILVIILSDPTTLLAAAPGRSTKGQWWARKWLDKRIRRRWAKLFNVPPPDGNLLVGLKSYLEEAVRDA